MTARKPDRLKLLAGTARPDRTSPGAPALPLLDAVPSAPAWLVNLDALREWHRLAPVLVANRLLHAGNLGVFGQYCALHGHLIAAWQSDLTPTAAMLSAYRALSVALGLAGMALSAPADSKPNRFAEIANRRTRR